MDELCPDAGRARPCCALGRADADYPRLPDFWLHVRLISLHIRRANRDINCRSPTCLANLRIPSYHFIGG
jgi:hypothetical protein